jgi:hypothetical protein
MSSVGASSALQGVGFSKETAQDITGVGGAVVDGVTKLAGTWQVAGSAVEGSKKAAEEAERKAAELAKKAAKETGGGLPERSHLIITPAVQP